MILDGVVNYFKSLAVSGSVVNMITNWRKKTTLYYADEEIINTSRSIELDATTDFTVILDTDLMKTPAENQVVYTAGALKKPKRIEIRAHVDVVKLEALNNLYENTIPVWVMCQKNMAGAITQVGYYSDGCRYGIQSINYVDTGYDNTVAVTLILEELRLFTYEAEYKYKSKTNKIIKKNKNSSATSSGKGEVVPYKLGGIFDFKNKYQDPNIVGGR